MWRHTLVHSEYNLYQSSLAKLILLSSHVVKNTHTLLMLLSPTLLYLAEAYSGLLWTLRTLWHTEWTLADKGDKKQSTHRVATAIFLPYIPSRWKYYPRLLRGWGVHAHPPQYIYHHIQVVVYSPAEKADALTHGQRHQSLNVVFKSLSVKLLQNMVEGQQ